MHKIKLPKIVIAAIITTCSLIVAAIRLSISWPPSWNPSLKPLLLNIAASLIGVLVGAFIAIFFVERYLEHQRREAQIKEKLRIVRYTEWWRGWIHGGLSVLTAIIMHLSYFLLYGQGKWKTLMITGSKKTTVPETIGDFVFWLINTKDKLKPDISKKKLAQFEKEFNNLPKSTISITRRDLEIILNRMERYENRIRDQLFLFQPFMDKDFELASSLLFFARSLHDTTHESKPSLTLVTKEGKYPESFHLDDRAKALFQSLGKEALKVSKILLAEYEAKRGNDS